MGVLYATNLTPGGPLKDWTDGEIVRAIREGVAKMADRWSSCRRRPTAT